MSRRCVTLLELLIATVISTIAMFALVPPFLAEGNLFRKGQRQTEAQRDAQMAMRAIARVARESGQMLLPMTIPDGVSYVFETSDACGVKAFVKRDSTRSLQFQEQCVFPGIVGPLVTLISGDVDPDGPEGRNDLIDRNESWLTEFTIDRVGPAGSSKTIHVLARVQHGGTEEELLETTLFLRNWSPN